MLFEIQLWVKIYVY